MNNTLLWLWAQRGFGYSARINDVLAYFGGIQRFYEARENDYRSCELFGKSGCLSRSHLALLTEKDLSFAKRTVELCEKNGIYVLTPEDEAYPRALLKLSDYPAALFVKGTIPDLSDRLSLAVIGSRTPTDYAQTAAASITGTLAEQGALIVSGGALGIDSIAHRTALEKHQQTILVLGCGILCNYLSENLQLRNEISENGALVSEYQPEMRPMAASFPQRNRLISGLSDGIVIVEAGSRSGTLNTANHAKQQHRPIFVVPGAVSSASFAGSNQLIREGAKPVFSAEDILAHFDMIYALENSPLSQMSDRLFAQTSESKRGSAAPAVRSDPSRQRIARSEKKQSLAPSFEEPQPTPAAASPKALPDGVSKNAKDVYESIICGKNQMDEIVLSVALPTAKVLSALTELELFGLISKGEGNYYTVNDTENSV